MINKKSAGILLYRHKKETTVFLVHPGGPFWKKKDNGSWTIPKGELNDGEDALAAARREFHEETGYQPSGPFLPLKPVRQKAGKEVQAWAADGDLDPAQLKSNLVHLEWPKGTGRQIDFPEVDRGEWFDFSTAREKINIAQVSFIDELEGLLRDAEMTKQ